MASEYDHRAAMDFAKRHQDTFNELFNAGDSAAINAMYVEDAVGIWEPGLILTGKAREDYVVEFMATRNATVQATVVDAYVVGDTAMVVVDWTMDTTGTDGKPELMGGIAVDVLRQGPDGKWRYVIDNPYAVREGPAAE